MAAGDLITQPYQMEYNGMLWGAGTDFILTKVEGLLGTADVKTTDFDRMDAWGEFPGRDMFKGRIITVTMDVLGYPDPDSHADIQVNYDNLSAALALPDTVPPQAAAPLVFNRNWTTVAGKRFYWARPGKQTVPSDAEFVTGHFQIVFQMKCNDPRAYSLYQYEDVYTVANGNTSITSTSTNEGNSASAPLLVVSGPAVNPTVTNLQDGNKSLGMTINLGPGDLLNIDMKARTIMLNGSTDVSYTINNGAQFWKLQPGVNNVTYTRQSTGASSTMTVYHNHVWSS